MTRHSEKRAMPYEAAEMYALVADIASYPEFLPWCAAARIRARKEEGGVETVDADLVISFKVFREKFGSRVKLDPGNWQIDTAYLDGPFKYLRSTWRFAEAEGGCLVSFDLDFEFKSVILQKTIGLVFHEAMQRIVRAFEDRARNLYG